MQRTVKLRLNTTPEQRYILLETMQQYAACFNAVAAVGWEQRITNGVALHKATYYPLRSEHPDIPSQLVISARMKATESIKSAFARQKRGRKATQPKSKHGAVRYDARTYTCFRDRQCVSLSTIAGRQSVPVSVPDYFSAIIEQSTGFDSADLVYRRNSGTFWLHMVVTLPDVETDNTGPVIGVDLGMTRIAVTSTNIFINGRKTKDIANRYFRLRRELQAKGTRSAMRKLRKIRRREQRFRSDVNHVVSKRIVDACPHGGTIVLEDLTNIRENTKQRDERRRRQHASWSFAELRAMITYKAEARGIRVIVVDPAYTSQTCPRCGCVDKSNRLSQSWFSCVSCGYQSNADRVAALNLAERGISVLGGLPVSQPDVSGDDAKAANSGTAAEPRCKPTTLVVR